MATNCLTRGRCCRKNIDDSGAKGRRKFGVTNGNSCIKSTPRINSETNDKVDVPRAEPQNEPSGGLNCSQSNSQQMCRGGSLNSKRKRKAGIEAGPKPPPTAPKKVKRNNKLKKQEREDIAHSLKQLDLLVLVDEVTSQLKLQYGERSLNKLVDLLCLNEELLKEMLECHRSMFIHLYLDTGKKKDPFLNFIIKWNHHCSAMLLEELYGLTEINLDKQLSKSLKVLRTKWLDFCKASGFPVPVSNPVTITLSSTIYNTLITYINLKGEESEKPTEAMSFDGDDVYYRFGGAAICEMLHLRYEQIKTAPFSKKDSISQEITILQAINCKDKSTIPNYLKYRDLGFMYFPHPTFIPLLRNLDTTLKEVVNPSGMEKYGSSLIKVTGSLYCFVC